MQIICMHGKLGYLMRDNMCSAQSTLHGTMFFSSETNQEVAYYQS